LAWPVVPLVMLLAAPPLLAQSSVIAEFAVHSGRYARVNVPVTAVLNGVPLNLAAGAPQLYEITGGREAPVPSQLDAGDPARLSWILTGTTAAGQVRAFELRVATAGAPDAGSESDVRVEDDGGHIRVGIGDRPVLAYQYAIQPAPEGVNPIFNRGGFIHPLYSPAGEVITRIQPPDHYHHFGIWNPWTHTEFEGRQVDFWNIGGGQGTVRPTEVIERVSGPVAGEFRAVLDHVAFAAPAAETVALKEQWDVRVWNADPERKIWLVDFVSTLSPATNAPLKIVAYRYQGFSLRATEKWGDATATLLTSAGMDKSNANGTRARWIDVNGVSIAPQGTSGVLFMTHPENYNFPEQLRIWPTGMNGGRANVFINFNPAQEQDWLLEPGRAYTLRYRMLVYDGKVDTATTERYWRDFADPPDVEVFPTGRLTGARVLVYTKNGQGYVHDNIAASVAAIKRLGEQYGFAVDASDDPGVFTAQNLAQYDALVFSNTNNQTFDTDEQRRAFQGYIRAGGGFVGIHSASGSERTWAWYAQLVGGRFKRHPPQQDFTVAVVDRAHPSTSFLPDRWEISNDECYYHDEMNPGIHVLLAADLTTVEDPDRGQFPGRVFADRFPIAWYQEFDGGREWYTALGHRPEEYQDPVFLRHILGGIRWVVG
jgi:type 1 glutamine amidotransferase